MCLFFNKQYEKTIITRHPFLNFEYVITHTARVLIIKQLFSFLLSNRKLPFFQTMNQNHILKINYLTLNLVFLSKNNP